ncbi:MAG: ABC transporter ATP-binding protein [Rhizobiaceae bacterium]
MTQNTPTGLEKGTGASIEIQDLSKKFGEFTAVSDFNLSIRGGEFISVLGASGSGKTTVLRILAGLEEPTGGRILIDGQDATLLPSEERDIGLVFQDYALFPHMSVEQNIAFPLRMRKVPKDRIRADVDRILALVGASHLRTRKPNQLSGQQQRIALARALVFNPKLLLLDEPLSALDKNLREHMKAEIKALHRKTGVTVIYVTHDQSEALALSDRVVVMRDGRISGHRRARHAVSASDLVLSGHLRRRRQSDRRRRGVRLGRQCPDRQPARQDRAAEIARPSGKRRFGRRPHQARRQAGEHRDRSAAAYGWIAADRRLHPGDALQWRAHHLHRFIRSSSGTPDRPVRTASERHVPDGDNVPIGLRTDRFVAVPDNGESVGP